MPATANQAEHDQRRGVQRRAQRAAIAAGHRPEERLDGVVDPRDASSRLEQHEHIIGDNVSANEARDEHRAGQRQREFDEQAPGAAGRGRRAARTRGPG